MAVVLSLVSSFFVTAQDDDFIPLQISLVPGLAIPFGYGDVGLGLGAIGALTRDVQGAAASGVFTISRSIQGIQANGVFGVASGKVEGVQSAGVFTIAGGRVSGAQLAGVFAIAGGKVSGAQLSGVFNIGGDVDGAQAAGLFNISGDYHGPVQVAGIINVATRVQGTQISGLANVADDISGAQIGPIVNVADRVRGLQVGLVNIAGRLDGVQFGLVNIARNGIGGSGLLFDPVSNYSWLFWQNGTPSLFTRLAAGKPTYGNWEEPDGLIAQAGLGSRSYFGAQRYRSSWLDLEVAADWYLGPAASSLHDDMVAIHASGGASCDFGDPRGEAAFAKARDLLPSRPWPSLSLTLGIPVLWRLEALIGVRTDIDLAYWPAMPDAFRSGMDSGKLSLFGGDFHLYSKWFFGFRL